MISLLFQILKFASLLIGSVSGLIGTLSDTKDKKSGKLTKSGKTILTLLVISGMIALVSQTFETYLENQANLKREQQRRDDDKRLISILDKASQAAQNGEKSVSRLEDVAVKQEIQLKSQNKLYIQNSRLLTPLFPLELRLTITYPRDYPGFKYYLNWLEKKHSSPSTLLLSIPVSRGSGDEPNSDRNSMEYPAKTLTEPWIEIFIFKEGNKQLAKPDLVLMGGVDNVSEYLRSTATALNYDSDAKFEYSIIHPEKPIESIITLTNPLVDKDNGEIFSFLDLHNATLIVDITNSKNAKGILNSIEFQFKSGRRIVNEIVLKNKDLFEWKDLNNERNIVYKITLKASQSGISRVE